MRTRILGKTEISVSELSLGTWGLSGEPYGPVPEGEARRVIDRALAMGITLFETADSYGSGAMETELGKALSERAEAGGAVAEKEAVVVTKWGTDLESSPPQKRFSDDFLNKSAEASLERLGNSVKVVGLLHNPSSTALTRGDGVDALRKMADRGKIASWGISVSDEETARAALTHEPPVLSIPYNVLHVRALRGVADELKEQNTGLLVHSVLFYGLLAGRWPPNKDFRSYDHRSERWGDGSLRQRVQQLDAVRPLVSGDVVSMRSAAVRFVLENPLIHSAVLGPRTSSQLDQLVRECRGEPPYLSAGKMSAVEGRLSELGVER